MRTPRHRFSRITNFRAGSVRKMINEISASPKAKNNSAKAAFLTALLLAAAAFTVYLILEKYKIFPGMIAFFAVVFAVVIYTKYLSSVLRYDVMIDSGGEALFIVRQIIGKRQTVLCRVALSDVISVVHETRKERRRLKTPTGYRKYAYFKTFLAPDGYRLTVSSRYERAYILIEASDDFAALLDAYAKEAREKSLYEE